MNLDVRRRRISASRRAIAAFTLIELLVVIAIIAVLMALLVPAVQKVREAAARTQCANNMKQLGLALHGYYGEHKCFPPGRTTTTIQHSWSAFILPYIEQKNAFQLYNTQKSWSDPANYSAIRTQIAVFNCPSVPTGMRFDDTISAAPACGDYFVISAIHPQICNQCFGFTPTDTNNDPRVVGALQKDRITKFINISDGTSNTILIAEDAGRPQLYNQARKTIAGTPPEQGGWADPGANFSVDGSNEDGSILGPCSINCSNNSEVYSFHSNGATTVFADGSVHFLAADIDLCVLGALSTRSGDSHEEYFMKSFQP